MNQDKIHDSERAPDPAERDAELAQILAAEARATPSGSVDEHPPDEVLAAYLDAEGGLEASREAEIRSHLVACRACTERLLGLDVLAAPDPLPADDAPADFARAAAWRSLEGERRNRRSAVPVRTFGLVAACLLAVMALAYVLGPAGGGDEAAEVAFQPNLPIHYLDELTRSRSFETSTIQVDADALYWALILTPPAEAERYPRYVVELRDAAGDLLFRDDALIPGEHGTLHLGIPTAAVPEGEARLALRGVAADPAGEAGGDLPEDAGVEIEEYPLRIVYR